MSLGSIFVELHASPVDSSHLSGMKIRDVNIPDPWPFPEKWTVEYTEHGDTALSFKIHLQRSFPEFLSIRATVLPFP